MFLQSCKGKWKETFSRDILNLSKENLTNLEHSVITLSQNDQNLAQGSSADFTPNNNQIELISRSVISVVCEAAADFCLFFGCEIAFAQNVMLYL